MYENSQVFDVLKHTPLTKTDITRANLKEKSWDRSQNSCLVNGKKSLLLHLLFLD